MSISADPVPALPPSSQSSPGKAEGPIEADEQCEYEEPSSFYAFFRAAPAWLVSTLLHVLILLVLGLVTLADPTKIVNVLSATKVTDDGPEMEEFAIEVSDPGELSELEEVTEPVDVSESIEIAEPVPMEPMEIATVAMEITDLAAEMAPSAASLQTLESMTMVPLSSRTQDMKKKMLREFGGSASSEAAVTEALKWFSKHQMPNGAWTFNHSIVCKGACRNGCEPKFMRSFNGATSMALLPFLGAGQTHFQGEFKDVVFRGLRFLVQNGRKGKEQGLPVMDFRDPGGSMYSHGLAAITLCEAYAMTQDPELAIPAQAALNFIVVAQCKDGGWRYSPRQADGGDTSVVGWQVMALKSGHMGHLMVPRQAVNGSSLFLDKVQSDGGSIYGYAGPSTNVRPATTAVGLLCRMYLGWDKTHPGIVRGVEHLGKVGFSKTDYYYNYYAAQVLRQYGGPEWDKFNVALRDFLVAEQDQRPGYKGSWFVEGARHTGAAGRLAATSFATMMLEVYYRHMPLYADSASEDEFPL
ncbi:MAG: prenyltransferase/squalene oxidase repeat-containing protein [Rubripirellula sp.]